MPNYQNYGEAVVLPTMGATNAILQSIQRRKQEEALTQKQIADNLATYDPNKIRDEDLPGFYDRYSKLKDLSMRYKDALRNPAKNIEQLRQLDQARNDLGAYIVKSKARKDFQAKADALYTGHAKDLNMDDFLAKRKLLSLPIDDPNSDKAPADITDFKLNTGDLNMQKFYAPVYKDNPLSTKKSQSIGPNGEILTKVQRVRDIEGTLRSISSLYDNDHSNAQKGFEQIFEQMPDQERASLTNSMQSIIPGFKVDSPKNLAIANGMIGKMLLDGGQVQNGYTLAAQEAKSRRLQDRSAGIQQSLWEQRRSIANSDKSKAKQPWIPKMSAAMKTNDPNVVQTYIGELSDAAPGVEYGFMNKDVYNSDSQSSKNLIEKITRDRAGARDIPRPADLERGFIYVKVPVARQKGGKNITYRYMIASPSRKDLPNSLNRILNAARGTKKYGGATDYPSPLPGPNSLSPIDQGDDNE